MDFFHRQKKYSGTFLHTLRVLGVLVLAGIAFPARAQTHPPAFFPYPSTFEINGIVNYSNLLGVQAAAVGDFNGDGKLDVVSITGGGWELDVAPGNGDGTFQIPIANIFTSQLPTGHGPYAMAVGDFNGDGRLDVAVWGIYSPGPNSEVNIFLGNGNGTFNYGSTLTAPNTSDGNPGSNSLSVADFNGDGHLDLAALAPYCASNLPCLSVFLGKGDGTFQTGVPYSTVDPNHPNYYNSYGMAVGDLTGDGKPDIAVTQNNGMVVLLNNGNGTFGTATYYDNGINNNSEIGIAIGDVNGDGKNDIVTTTFRYGDLVLYLNQGGGTFARKGSVGQAPGGSMSWLVSMADINGDKKLDLVATDGVGEIWTFYGKGDGTFTAGPVYPVQYWEQPPDNVILADFNKDGVVDIFKEVSGHSWDGEVILGRSNGTFQTNSAYGWNANGYGYNLVTADFNGDGFPDVAYSGARSSNLTQPGFEVSLGSSHGALGAPTFVPVAPAGCYVWTEWVAAGDVNGDGKADIVATVLNNSSSGCPNNQVAVLTGLGTGKFNTPVYYSTGSTAQSNDVFLQDLNGDGKPDIVISNADGTISVLLNNGKGVFGTASAISSVAALSPHLNSLSFGDFNGDGKLDIAAASYYPGSYSGNVYILLGDGDGTFQAPITVAAAPQYVYTNTLAAGDFNKDGKTDLLVTLEGSTGCTGYYGAAAYVVLTGNGAGGFSAGPYVCTGGDYPEYPVIADLNGDGKPDVFIPMLENYGINPYGPVLLKGNGDGTFTALGESEYQYVQGAQTTVFKGGFNVGPTSRGAVIADFNADGMPDIAVLNADNFAIGDYVTFVTVMQNGTQPVSVSPLALNFGVVAAGTTKALTVLLTNDQSSALSITSVAISGTNASDFTATSGCGKTVRPGFQCMVTVKFTAPALGAESATLTIQDSAGAQTVALVVMNPRPAITSLVPGSVLAGSGAFTLTVNGTNFVTTSVVNWSGAARPTTYVSPTQLTATITAAQVFKAGTYKVTVTNPAPGGGTTAFSNFVVNNPVPTLTAIAPSSATHGGAAFTLKATGTGFVSTSTINWNGTPLTTKYVGSTTLTTTVPATNIAAAGTASVTVASPAPGGGTSAPQTFTIK